MSCFACLSLTAFHPSVELGRAAVWSFASMHPACRPLLLALLTVFCAVRWDPAELKRCSLIYGSFLCSTNAFAGVDFKRCSLTHLQAWKFLFHQACSHAAVGKCAFSSGSGHFPGADMSSQELLGGGQAGTVRDPSAQGILTWR